MERNQRITVGGIMTFHDLCLIGVMSAPDQPGIGAAIFRTLGRARLSAQFIVQCIDLSNESHVLFCVTDENCDRVLDLVRPTAEELEARDIQVHHDVALISVFGPDFRERPGIAGAMFDALAGVGVNILAISTSISTVTCVIEQSDQPKAIEALHQVFMLP